MKLPENYKDLTVVLLSHLQTESAPHTSSGLREQLTTKIKSEDIGELVAYALKQNLIYINYELGQVTYKLTNMGKLFVQRNEVSPMGN